ncbi:lipopolysaccharide kinase InaA family protein [Pseudomonas sp. CNPSo 3701]|uniref:lipopolysaccharide kinase InaA family protein n=1 Tax=Pseudomonas sp. CNPSo 3701 TaxID=3027943 RepID=UPI002363F5BA|nr:lipopolysaccharide kinase InaA family protein [Pseudomonas sp. CNPSo 3701]MDD1509227.1 lipopolysaccharide kinase InaA family protein [Pseudomonas sp. CNPSo 3701]
MATVVFQHPATRTSAFERWWQCQGTWVEPLNQRRDGESGVQRLLPRNPSHPLLYSKRQIGHLYRSLRYPLGRPTILRELNAYQAFARLGIRVPKLIYGSTRKHEGQWQALLITQALTGFVSLEQWYQQPQGAERTRCMLAELGNTLARLHQGRWQHGCCYAKHVFIRIENDETASPRTEIALLDLEKSRRRWRTADASRHDMRQLKRHCGTMPDEDWQLLMWAYKTALDD